MLLFLSEISNVAAHRICPVDVGIDPEQADRPICPEAETLGPEYFEGPLEVVLQSGLIDLAVGHLSYHSADLYGADIVSLCERSHAVLPFIFNPPVVDNGLGNVIDDEGLTGVPVNELKSLRQMPLKDKDIVDEIVILELGNAAIEFSAEYEVVIGFVLYYVTHSLELVMLGEAVEVVGDLGISERNPAHYSPDEVTLIR